MLALHLLLRRVGRRIRTRAPAGGEPRLGSAPSSSSGRSRWPSSGAGWRSASSCSGWSPPPAPSPTRPAAEAVRRSSRRGCAWLRAAACVLGLVLAFTYFVIRFAGTVVRAPAARARGAPRRPGGAAGRHPRGDGGGRGAGAGPCFFGLLAVLARLEVDLVPVLASAGVAGIALGFGVQTLIRDFFTGLFILIEDQYGVGDVIKVGEVTGKVEHFTLRITQVRSLDGSLTSIPNGEIITVTNLSKDWSQVVLDVNIELGEDVDRAIAVIERTADQLAAAWGDRIEGEPEVLGVETVDPQAEAITIRVVLRTAPLERWAVSRELRRRILDAFRAEEIEVPPRSVVNVPSAGSPRP